MKDILILAGPSAVGKTTVTEKLLQVRPDLFSFTISMTTRPSRSTDDVEYTYVTASRFQEAVAAGELAEYTTYGEYSYGTPKSEIERVCGAGKCPLLILDYHGVASMKRVFGEDRVFAVYLYDSLNVMEERLYARYLGDSPSVAGLSSFMSRKQANIDDFAAMATVAPSIDIFVKNDQTPDEAVAEILEAFFAARAGREVMAAETRAERIAACVCEAEEKNRFTFQR